jgi:Fe-Mn family superoxide dismutase
MHIAKNYKHLLGMKGFSNEILKNHFKLYEGYVANVNKIGEMAESLEIGTPQYAEVKRRFGWEWNGMRLHELYFGNMKQDAQNVQEASGIYKKIAKRFGSFEKWLEDFKGTGAMRGIGWAILAYDKEEGRLFNVWINEHDVGHLAGATPLLVMDVFEHAFVLDYGMNRGEYIDAFMNAINWDEIEKRLTT